MQLLVRSLFQSAFRTSFRLFAAGFALSFAVWHTAQAAPQSFRDLKIEVVGKGLPVLMIPGLNSAGETWTETCAALQADHVQCHIVTLPGFAGQPAARDASKDAWLDDMRDRLLAYVKARKLSHPVVIGHSLGGFVALQMAIKQPDAVGRLVIVDALPFFTAAQNPAATEENARPFADNLRKQILARDPAPKRDGVPPWLQGMTREAQRTQTLVAWGDASDRATTAEAMYEMLTRDARPQMAQIHAPTLVLGAWAAFAPYGATKESTAAIFKTQFASLKDVRIEMSDNGYHFLMWDDPQWLQAQVRGFVATAQ
ncbi:alpha/beta fold hydrolase [Lysobacter fragariae]